MLGLDSLCAPSLSPSGGVKPGTGDSPFIALGELAEKPCSMGRQVAWLSKVLESDVAMAWSTRLGGLVLEEPLWSGALLPSSRLKTRRFNYPSQSSLRGKPGTSRERLRVFPQILEIALPELNQAKVV